MLRQEIRGNLARLLATENLIVEHRRVSTASFDVDRRVLTLPNWDRASNIVYDMLVGHEVGHALFTPNEDWRDVADCPKDFVNVIEDARIEKLMKRKFPGLRKSFAGGYRELNDQDFFGIANTDYEDISLIDRINLHFKCGADAMIPFSIEEKVFVARTDLAETFDEVLDIAVDVYEFSKQEKLAEVEATVTPEQSENESNDGEETEQQTETKSDSGDESQEMDGDADKTGSPEEEWEDEGLDYDDQTVGNSGGETAQTQRSFDGASEQLSNPYATNPTYIELPDSVNLEDFIADWTEIHGWIDEQREGADYDYEYTDAKYREFRKQSQKEVNYLVKEFECRKSADAYARAGQSKTGVLDTSKLHTYLYNEDLFKKVTILPDGKNHGMIFLLDWSGSMSREILDTVKQLINLTTFCKKVNIPFEVYAFTNDYHPVRRIKEGQKDYVTNDEYFKALGCEEGKIYLGKGLFHMMNMISSRSNSKDYERMCLNLFREAAYYIWSVGYRATVGIGLSGTPLNEAIVMLNYIIPAFKQKNDLQKVNVCVLSDGESCQAAYGRKFYNDHKDEYYIRPRRIGDNVVLRDRVTGRVYNGLDGWQANTNVFIQQVRDRFPMVNVIGFRIMPGANLSRFVTSYASQEHYAEVVKQWKKEKSAIIPEPKAFTALYAVSNQSLSESSEFNVESGAKKGEITRAFKKMLKSKSTNKKLLTSFIEHVA
mgnify:CR=1 FL=1|tara:strand:- start:537 stop:2678 length:2142 start_codon:yes stop_codon:yes gene_type:complete